MAAALKQITRSLEGLGAAAVHAGLFTHGEFLCGFLDDDEPILRVRCHQESKNEFVYDLASITKAFVATPLALKALWKKGLEPEVPLSDVFSDDVFDGLESAKAVLLSDVLRHEAGFPAWRNFYATCTDGMKRDVVAALNAAIAVRGPRGVDLYCDLGPILIGVLVARESNQEIAKVYESYCRDTLCASNLDLLPRPSWHFPKDICVPTGYCAVRNRVLQGEVHDENASSMGGFTAHAGLFASLDQVANYLRQLASTSFGQRLIASNALWAAKDINSNGALGWRTARDPSSKPFGGGHAVGHMGFTGTAFWLNPRNRSFAIQLSNRVISGRLSTMNEMRVFRARAFSIMQEAVDLQQS